MFGMSWHEMLIVGVIAILLFGKRLPEVAKSLGGSYRELKRQLAEFHSQVDFTDTSHTPSSQSSAARNAVASRDPDDYEETTAPRFEPPPSEPTSSRDASPPSGNIERPIGER